MPQIQKWPAIDRLTHWLLIIGVLITIITGLPIFENAFGFLLPLRLVTLPYGFTIHFAGAILIMAAALIHFFYRVGSRKSTEVVLGSKDIKDLGIIFRHWLGLTKNYPRLGFHHPGEKAVYWFMAVLGLILVGTSGLLLKFQPEMFATWRTAELLVHDIGFALMTVVLVGHFILAITPTNWPVLKAMLATGKVPSSWAKHHHPEWAEKVAIKEK